LVDEELRFEKAQHSSRHKKALTTKEFATVKEEHKVKWQPGIQ
jgi:hypothetical protein